jgi:hypothetical protein
MRVRALGTIVEWSGAPLTHSEFYSGFLDYYDHWASIDPRLATHYPILSPASEAFGHDIVNLATYANEILWWLAPDQIRRPPSVVIVGGMTEAFLYSVRSACDIVAEALAAYASDKRGQAPDSGLRALLAWFQRNPSRIDPAAAAVLSTDFAWFWKMRAMRDALGHRGAHANIHCDGHPFNLWLYGRDGLITREPLLPMLASMIRHVTQFADATAAVISNRIKLPSDRVQSRVVHGVLISPCTICF